MNTKISILTVSSLTEVCINVQDVINAKISTFTVSSLTKVVTNLPECAAVPGPVCLVDAGSYASVDPQSETTHNSH